MIRVLKIFLTLLLLMSLTLQSAGYFMLFLLRREAHREQMREQMVRNPANRHLLAFSWSQNDLSSGKPEIQWKDGGREFRLNGVMYDVLRKMETRDSLKLYCVSDERESLLLDNFIRDLESRQDDKQTRGCIQMLQKIILSGPHDFISVLRPELSLFPPRSTRYLFPLNPYFGEIPSPPPRVTSLLAA